MVIKMNEHIGKQTVIFEKPPIIRGTSSIVGAKEGKGPLSEYFDKKGKAHPV